MARSALVKKNRRAEFQALFCLRCFSQGHRRRLGGEEEVMEEAVLEPNESKKSKVGSEWAMSIGKMESNNI